MQNKCFGVVGEGSLENSHSIIEQYRPSPCVAMLIRGFYGGIRGMGWSWGSWKEIGGWNITGGKVPDFICNP